MYISNADRGAGKPNILTNGKNFKLLDHELAFSFVLLLPFLRSKTPWLLTEAEREMYEKHYFYSILKDNEINFKEFTDKLSRIDDYFWKRVYEFMPFEWQTDDIEVIKNYLDLISKNKQHFSDTLSTVLLT